MRATDHSGNLENRVAAASQQSETNVTKACPKGELKERAAEERGLPRINNGPEGHASVQEHSQEVRKRVEPA